MNDQSTSFEPLAVVGMACRFPGADNLDEFWGLLRDGRSAFGELPADRLNLNDHYSPEKGVIGKTYCKVAGVVPLRPLDPLICPLDPDLASHYDAGHLVLCEVAAAACRNAGYDPFSLPIRNTGVYIGNSSGGSDLASRLAYHSYAREMAERLRNLPAVEQLAHPLREQVIADAVAGVRAAWPDRRTCPVKAFTAHSAAALLTTAFGLTGPSLLADAACASSLMSLLLAANDLQLGRVDMAIVAGAAYRKLYEWLGIALAQSMSTRTSCPFDAQADGLITADGYGVVVVKTLSRALADGDRVLGVIRSIGLSSDGRGKSFWAPRMEGQIEAIRRAYAGGEDPSLVDYIEAHATSTQLGDATEVAALTHVFSGVLPAKIPVASVKGNIGHALESAGIAGLIKTLLAMQHDMIPPAANFQTPSDAIDWERAPVYVPRTGIAWPKRADGQPRRAAIDSFGIGGLNLHVVVDDAPTNAEARIQTPLPSREGLGDFGELSRVEGGITRTSHHPPNVSPQLEREPIAIIGMGCRFPGAMTIDAFWRLLESGDDPKQTVPADRWSVSLNRDRLAGAQDQRDLRGGYLSGWEFDWKKFKIPPRQVASANPLQFMLLEAAAQALEDAGYADKPFDHSRTGAIVGTMFRSDFITTCWQPGWLGDFRRQIETVLAQHGTPSDLIAEISQQYSDDFLRSNPAFSDESGSGSYSTLASRIAKHFDLMGGAMSIDAGDVSAAAAIRTAVDLLVSRRCDMVLAAAGQRSADLVIFEEFALSGELSGETHHATFDANSQGSVPGEGAGVLVLKRLSDAERDGDRIHAVIRGTGIDTDPGSADWAIRGALERALLESGVTAEEVGLMEAGDWFAHDDDRIAEALAKSWGTGPTKNVRTLGSMRAQFGHLQGAGGMAALMKAVLELKNARVPAEFGFTNRAVPLYATTGRGTCVAAIVSYSNHGYLTGGGTACQVLVESAAPLPRLGASPPALPPLDDGRVMSRFILRTVDAPLPDDAPLAPAPTFHGAAVILGQNACAEALTARLLDAGVIVYELPIERGVAGCLETLDQIWQQRPAPHLFLMTARDDDAAINVEDEAEFQRRHALGVMLPYLVCQRWFSWVENQKLLDQASVMAATSLGGDFGFSGHCAAVEGGGMSGMLKSLSNETRGRMRVKVVDAPPREPAGMIAVSMLKELASGTPDVEVGYVRGRRHAVRAMRELAADLPRREIPRGSVWVVTGGARGVTAEAALELGRRYALKMHLIGSSPSPQIDPTWRDLDEASLKSLRTEVIREALARGQSAQSAASAVEKAIEIDRTLTRFREAGVEAVYHACDVSNRQALGACLARIRQLDGPITGVIHGAGDQSAARFQKKKPEHVARVLGAKLEGTAALMALTRDDPLKYFVAFGSTSGRFGGYIQTDYSLANDMLAKMVNDYRMRRPGCAAFTFHWTAWGQVGMATSTAAEVVLSALNVRRMSVAEGIEHFIDELEANGRETEILIVDHPGGVHSDHITMPSADHMKNHARFRENVAGAPLIDLFVSDEPQQGIAAVTLDPTCDPFLLGHLDQGTPLLPAVMGIELFCEAGKIFSGGQTVVELRDYKLLNGLRTGVPCIHRARVHLALDGDEVRCRIDGDFYDKHGRFADPARQYQTATLVLAESLVEIPYPDLGIPPSDWTPLSYPDDWRNARGSVFYGPELRTLKAVHYDADGAWGQIVAESPTLIGGARRGSDYRTNPAVMDAILFGCDLLAVHLFGARQLPHEIARLWLGRLPRTGETCLSRIIYRGREGRHLLFDFWLLSADGDVLCACEGCRFIDVDQSLRDAVGAGRSGILKPAVTPTKTVT